MLPKQVTDLIDNFVRAYESEHSAETEFRNAHQRFAESLAKRGFGWPSGAFLGIGKSVIQYLEAKAHFVWARLQHVITSTGMELYPELNADLKAEIEKQLKPSVETADVFLENLRQGTEAPLGAPQEIKKPFDTELLKIYAEVDLFCASLAKDHDKPQQRVNRPVTKGIVKGGRRQPIPKSVETQVLTKSLRRCCLCYGLNGEISQKEGQIAHLDQDRSNHRPDNLAWLCFAHHDSYDSQRSQGKGFTEREVKTYREQLWGAIAQKGHLSQYPKLKAELENQSVKLEVTASLSLESTDTRHGLLTIKALNSGTKVARIRRVAVLLVPEAQTIGGSTLTPVSSELNIGQKQAVVEIEGDDDMYEWQQVLNFMPHFEVHEREGERYGKGYVELTSGKKVEFEFLLLPDSAWSLLTAPIAPVFGNKAGHRCSRCGFVFLKQADATTVTCPQCKHVDALTELAQSNKALEEQFQDSQASPLVEAQPILLFLFDQGTGMTVEEIADATNQRTSTVEYYCVQLENGGFVRRCRFHGDQRRLYGSDWGYDLTQKGRGWVIKQSGAGNV